MLFSALVLISVEREHDSLEEGIYFCQTDKATECCYVAWLPLEEEE